LRSGGVWGRRGGDGGTLKNIRKVESPIPGMAVLLLLTAVVRDTEQRCSE